jgi:broad specificity phosphatase PhoE
MTQIILTRHGQTEWNRVERFRGRADIPLNETGLEQAAAASRRIILTWKPVAVYTSPLSRAVRTAEIIAAPLGLTPRRVEGLRPLQRKGPSREGGKIRPRQGGENGTDGRDQASVYRDSPKLKR